MSASFQMMVIPNEHIIPNDVIDNTMTEMLVINDDKPRNIYFLPKIHKNKNPPPGRPIGITIDTPTMNLSKWLDLQLQPFVNKLKPCLKDDDDFLRKINDINQKYQLSKNALLVTWGIKSLYTSVPHKDGLEALKKMLTKAKPQQY